MQLDFEPVNLTINTENGPVVVEAKAYNGLAYHLFVPAKPEMVEMPFWVVTHQLTGTCIPFLCPTEELIREFLLMISPLANWSIKRRVTWYLAVKVSDIYTWVMREQKQEYTCFPEPLEGAA